MLRWVACAALLAGCWGGDGSSAGEPCAPGNVRAGDSQACAAPAAAILVDGDASDWAGVPEIPLAPACRLAPCEQVMPDAVQFARTRDGLGRTALAFHVRLAGRAAPDESSSDELAVGFHETPEYPTGTRDLLLVTRRTAEYLRNGLAVEAPVGVAEPFAAELTDDGFEGLVTTAFLPFPFGARVSIYAVRRAPGDHILLDVLPSEAVARVCWLDQLGDDDLCREGP